MFFFNFQAHVDCITAVPQRTARGERPRGRPAPRDDDTELYAGPLVAAARQWIAMEAKEYNGGLAS